MQQPKRCNPQHQKVFLLNISRISDDFPCVFYVVPMLGTCYNKNNFAQNDIGFTKKVQQFMKTEHI
ncbi:MAG TPA: hypothetical protein DC053_01595 [Lachnoclostridium sp.]|nr:hypothetical protein [Lachnoclostridium sp.]